MKVVILAGGLGSRLSEETHIKPKPMVEIGPHPILWHIMKTYSHYGLNDFLIALGYKGDYIKEYFSNYLLSQSQEVMVNLKERKVSYGDSKGEDWSVHLVDTGQNSMTGGRIFRLREHLKDSSTFMVTYGDGVGNINISKLLEFHKSHGKIGTVTAVRPPARFGALAIHDDKVVDFHEKPQTGEGWINGGYFVFEPAFLDYLTDEETILEREPLESLASEGELMAFKHDGFWHPMDTIRDKQFLNSAWDSGEPPWKVWKDNSLV